MIAKLFALAALVAISTIASPVPEELTQRQGRIVGGFDVTEASQFPHQVSLRTLGNCKLHVYNELSEIFTDSRWAH